MGRTSSGRVGRQEIEGDTDQEADCAMTPKRRRRPNRPAPPWLPDWKREQSYPRTLSLDEWRWQFLRRRREYQDAYEAAPDEGWESAFLAAGKTWTAEIRSATPQQK